MNIVVIRGLDIKLHPNPTKDVIYINKIVELSVYNSLGKLIIKDESSIIDLSSYSNGMYNIITIFEGNSSSHRVIKN